METSPQPEAPSCAECVHLLGKRTVPEYYRAWLCENPQNIASRTRNLVTGLVETVYKDATCVECRQNAEACGPSGKGFEKYVQYVPPGKAQSTGGKASADALFAELENLK